MSIRKILSSCLYHNTENRKCKRESKKFLGKLKKWKSAQNKPLFFVGARLCAGREAKKKAAGSDVENSGLKKGKSYKIV